MLVNLQKSPYKGHNKINVGNRQGLQISNVGDVAIKTENGNLNLKNVLLVPNLKKNLFSIGQCTIDSQRYFIFHSHAFIIKN